MKKSNGEALKGMVSTAFKTIILCAFFIGGAVWLLSKMVDDKPQYQPIQKTQPIKRKTYAKPIITNKIYLKKSDFGDKWPVSVDEGELYCTKFGQLYFAIKDGHKRIVYAINGTARGRVDNIFIFDIGEIWLDEPGRQYKKSLIFLDYVHYLCDGDKLPTFSN